MNTRELITQMSARLEKPQTEVRLGLKQVIKKLRKTFAREQSYTMQNFGTFSVRKREKRKGFHPVHRRYILLPPKMVLRFKASKALKERLREGGNE
ncbi:HU family DNA-binding protein [candidate division KSB1 bacterium]|nr:HU family DNA-binding protein [candidate division KSB1 bacterium]